jgi:hypothetical protein
MKRTACICALILLCGAAPATRSSPATRIAAATTRSTTSPASGRSFADAEGHIAVTAPPRWTQMPNPPTGSALMLIGPARQGKKSQVFRVQIFSPPPGQQPQGTLDDFVADLIPNMTRKPPNDVKDVNVDKAVVGGAEARRFELSMDAGNGETVKILNYVADRGPDTFIFAYVDEQHTFDAAEAQAIVESIRWNKKEPVKP